MTGSGRTKAEAGQGQAKVRQGDANETGQSRAERGARQSRAGQGSTTRSKNAQDGWLLSLSCHSLAPRWPSLGERSERSATGGIWTGSLSV